MTIARTWAVALQGLTGDIVEVEADLSAQTPQFRIIGLADKAISEAHQRVHNACANSELSLPRRRITVNLSPAALPKQGSGFDVAIAVAALATEQAFSDQSLRETVHIGELGLDGRLRPVAGVLPATVAAARAGFARIVVPYANREEALLVGGIDVVAAVCLRDVARAHGLELDPIAGPDDLPPVERSDGVATTPPVRELSDVIGQREAVEALVVAAAGGHHLLMTGPPGAGKTMLAERLPGILPPLDERRAVEVACVRSLAGETVTRLTRTPPFEAPHHTASTVALIGGGSRTVRPGAIARASHGVLFLDEAAEFASHALDSLRQPLENGTITIHRAGFRAQFPARFQLVLATNPCPCGHYGVMGSECACPSLAIRRYLSKLSGPLVDRVDIEVAVQRVSVGALASGPAMSSADARAAVAQAQERAGHRLRQTEWARNAEVGGSWLRSGPHAPEPAVRRPLDAALGRGALSLRGYDRTLRVAWTLADLAGHERLTTEDIGGALTLKRRAAA